MSYNGKLDNSWIIRLDNPYCIGAAAEFQDKALKAIDKLEEFQLRNNNSNKYSNGYFDAIQEVKDSILNLKAE